MQMQQESKIPVFVFPTSITFILEDKTTHKQVLSLYNPYHYTIKYRVLSTSPEKYIVSSPEGTIPSLFRADIVIRHNDIKSSNCDIIDKFRIQIQDKINRKIIGRQDVIAILRNKVQLESQFPSSYRDNFQTIPASNQSSQTFILPTGHLHQETESPSTPSYVILAIAMLCIGGLLLPEEVEISSQYGFYISTKLKYIFAYVLVIHVAGLITTAILKL